MRLKGKAVYITGGAGMVGRGLVRRLHAEGCHVTVLSRHATTTNLPEAVEAKKADVTKPETLDFSDADAVVHGAAFVGFGLTPEKNRLMWDTNVGGTENVMDACARDGVKRVLHVSSVAAIGRTGSVPRGEEWVWQRPETFHSEYERTKYHAHRLAHSRHDVDVVSIMPSIVLGLGDSSSGLLLKRFLEGRLKVAVRHPGDLAFVHVNDIAEGAVLALTKGSGAYVLSECGMTLPQLFARFAALTGRPAPKVTLPFWSAAAGAAVAEPFLHAMGKRVPFSKDFIRSLREGSAFDNSRAITELGWTPSMDEHIREDAARWGSHT